MSNATPQPGPPLIVGAGPVGLAAALLMAVRGRRARIVERRTSPSRESRALAVNPRTLDILAPTGVSERMLERGLRIERVQMYRRDRQIAEVPLAGLHPHYPFMLALSQSASERLLEEALGRLGVRVERGVTLTDCRSAGGVVEAVLEHADGRVETVATARLLGADGSRSTVRERMGVGFPGTRFDRPWRLADLPLKTDLDPHAAHVELLDGRAFLFAIRAVEDARSEGHKAALWRVITNGPDPISVLTRATPAGEPVWASSFVISHRLAAEFARDCVYLAGDAAHVHSPIGARGMNLGVEDAAVFAELECAGRLSEYADRRRRVDGRVVRRVERLSRVASAEGWAYAAVRRWLLPRVVRSPLLRPRFLATLAGLDHPAPGQAPPAGAGRAA